MKFTYYLFFMSLIGFAQQTQDTLTLDKVVLDEVTVSALRIDDEQPFSFSNISKEEMASRNLGQDLPILMNFLPNVVTTSNAGAGIGYTGIRVRGSDATRVNVTINGIPYNDAESQGVYWVNLPDFASSVESIQLQRGVGSSTNGSGAFGASVHVTTNKISPNAYAEIANSFGSFNTKKHTLKFSTGLLNDVFEISGRLSKVTSDGYVDRASSDLKSYFLQGTYQSGSTQIKALLFGGHERTYQSWFGVDPYTLSENRTYNSAGEQYDNSDVLTGFYDDQVDNYNQDHYQLHWNQIIDNHWSASVGLNYTYGRGYYEEFNDLWYDQNVSFSGVTSGLLLQLDGVDSTENVVRKWLDNDFYVANLTLKYEDNEHTLFFGGSFSDYQGDHFGELVWASNAVTSLPYHRFYENVGKKDDKNIFVKWNAHLHDQWSLFIDLQMRWVDYNALGQIAGPSEIAIDKAYDFFNPKAGLTFQINDSNSAYFSYARANREPNRVDFENGNPIPEKLNDFELGWRHTSKNFRLNTNFYYMHYQEQLVLTGALDNVGAPIRENIGKSYRAGIEVAAVYKVSNQINWSANVAFSENKNKDMVFQRDGQLKQLGDTNISFSPSVIGSSQLSWSFSPAIEINLLSKYVGEQYMGNIDANLSKLERYQTHDLNITYHFKKTRFFESLDLSLLINNIFNQKYISDGYFYTYDDDFTTPGVISTIERVRYYPQAGTHLLLGLKVKI